MRFLIGLSLVFLLLGTVFWCGRQYWVTHQYWLNQIDTYRRGTVEVAAENFGFELPQGDDVQIFVLGLRTASQSEAGTFKVEGDSQYPITSQKTISANEAKQFREHWRAMTFAGVFSKWCHQPIYGLRFLKENRALFETTFCWNCSNFSVQTPLGLAYCGFDNSKTEAERFWQLLQKHAPLP